MAEYEPSSYEKAAERAADIAFQAVSEVYLCRNAPPEDVGQAILNAKQTIIGLYALSVSPLSFSDEEPEYWGTTIYETMVRSAEEKYGDQAYSQFDECSDKITERVREFEKAFVYQILIRSSDLDQDL